VSLEWQSIERVGDDVRIVARVRTAQPAGMAEGDRAPAHARALDAAGNG
jgi:hypothetical protein